MEEKGLKILVYGYGNPGRQDDGLGVVVAEQIEEWAEKEALEGIEVDSNYQLNIEDASNIADFDLVYFVDASKEEMEGFFMEELEPSVKVDFSTHSASPGFILELCQKVYGKRPQVYLMHIKGYEWEFMAEMSPSAKNNLEEALAFLKAEIKGALAAGR